MKKCYVFMAEGFEDMELTITVDMLRRAEIETQTVSLRSDLSPVKGSRGISMLPDLPFEKLNLSEASWLILPGGTEGTRRLSEDSRVLDILRKHAMAGGYIAATCAAPTVLVKAGLAEGRTMTSHPSMRGKMTGVNYSEKRVEIDGQFVTSRAAGTTFEFAAAIITIEKGAEVLEKVNSGVLAKLS